MRLAEKLDWKGLRHKNTWQMCIIFMNDWGKKLQGKVHPITTGHEVPEGV
jgi:hypothetical protein